MEEQWVLLTSEPSPQSLLIWLLTAIYILECMCSLANILRTSYSRAGWNNGFHHWWKKETPLEAKKQRINMENWRDVWETNSPSSWEKTNIQLLQVILSNLMNNKQWTWSLSGRDGARQTQDLPSPCPSTNREHCLKTNQTPALPGLYLWLPVYCREAIQRGSSVELISTWEELLAEEQHSCRCKRGSVQGPWTETL